MALSVKKASKRMQAALLIDDDYALFNYLREICQSQSVFLDHANTLKSAEEKLQKQQYDLIIVDQLLPDGTGTDFISGQKKTKKSTTPIIFTSSFDIKSLSILKELAVKSYPKPLSRETFSSILKDHFSNSSIESPYLVGQSLKKVKACYDNSIPSKLEFLYTCIDTFIDEPSLENLIALRDLAHQFAGSAGSYGYMNVTNLCNSFENTIEPLIKYKICNLNKEVLKQFLVEMRLCFNDISYNPNYNHIFKKLALSYAQKKQSKASEADFILIYDIVDKTLSSQIEQLCSVERIPLFNINDNNLSHQITDLTKVCILIQKKREGFSVQQEQLKSLTQKISHNLYPPLIGLITEDTLEDRLSAVQNDFTFYFSPTTSYTNIISIFEKYCHAFYTFDSMILYLYNNASRCNLVASVFNGTSYHFKSITDADLLIQEIKDQPVSLLILENSLLGINVVDVIKVIRSDPSFNDLALITLIDEGQEDLEIMLLNHGCDAVVYSSSVASKLFCKVNKLMAQKLRLTCHYDRK
ncbi:MAG: response regulator transcription factor [Chlamydiales bacterium]|jgi:DNA-binding response OmpR family regulator|nr:response regulator transcription factor [Chlamydiales bacterium]